MGKLLGISLFFIVYMGLVDIIRGTPVAEASIKVASLSLNVLLLRVFMVRSDTFPLIKWFRRLVIISAAFALMQFSGLHYALPDLIPDLGIIGSDEGREELIDIYGRATGATSNTIAFALQMTMLILIMYGSHLAGGKRAPWLYGLVGVAGLLLSQTRAALIGMFPAVFTALLLFGKPRLDTLYKIAIISLFTIFALWLVQYLAPVYFPYLAKEIDDGDTHRLWTNWYMTVGVFEESPIFGISPSDAWDVYFRHADPSAPVQYDPDMLTPTHHNQPGYYFRYYGFVGLFLLFAVYFRIISLIRACRIEAAGIAIGAIVLLDFAFSFTHNNKLMSSPLIWIMLSLMGQEGVRAQGMWRSIARGA
jgi:hypothetical protein